MGNSRLFIVTFCSTFVATVDPLAFKQTNRNVHGGSRTKKLTAPFETRDLKGFVMLLALQPIQ